MKTTIKLDLYSHGGVISMITKYEPIITNEFEADRGDIDKFHWDKAEHLPNGTLSVPVFTRDIDGDGPHEGHMIFEQCGADIDYSVGDWEPVK